MADLLERRWQLSIIYAALSGALRFNEFAEAIRGISPRMLRYREALGPIETLESVLAEVAKRNAVRQVLFDEPTRHR